MAAMTNDQFSSLLDIVGQLAEKQKSVQGVTALVREVKAEMPDAPLALHLEMLARLTATAKDVNKAALLITEQAESIGD